MIGCCAQCGRLFEGSDEDTSGPWQCCAPCYRKNIGRLTIEAEVKE